MPHSNFVLKNVSFRQCRKVTEMKISDKLEEIPKYYCAGCVSLMKVSFSQKVKVINDFSFLGCSSLKSINLPSSLESINDFAFYGCSSLIEVSFSCDKLKSIGNSAFKGCSSLKEIEIPSSVTFLGDFCFEFCSSLSKISFSSVEKIGICVFHGCTSLESVAIPPSVALIGTSAFKYCTSLKEISIPSSETKICDFAFYGCSSLSKITTQSLIQLGYKVFDGCLQLQDELDQLCLSGKIGLELEEEVYEEKEEGEENTIKIRPVNDFNKKSPIVECIDLHKYTKEELFHNHATSQLFSATDKITQKVFIAKINAMNQDIECKDAYSDGLKVRLTIDHPLIAKTFGISFKDWNSKHNNVLLLQQINDQNLADLIRNNQLDDTEKQIILIGIAYSVKYLHELNIIHQNISSRNVLLDENKCPHLIGLSLSHFDNDYRTELTLGTPLYMSPEAFHKETYKGSDVYSFGILMYEIITGNLPFDLRRIRTINDIKKSRPKFSLPMKESLKSLIEDCCNVDYMQRPTFNKIFNSLSYDNKFYLDGVDGTKIKNYVDSITLD